MNHRLQVEVNQAARERDAHDDLSAAQADNELLNERAAPDANGAAAASAAMPGRDAVLTTSIDTEAFRH